MRKRIAGMLVLAGMMAAVVPSLLSESERILARLGVVRVQPAPLIAV